MACPVGRPDGRTKESSAIERVGTGGRGREKWREGYSVENDKCQTNHKVGQPFTEIVRPFLDECLRLNNYFILSRETLSF